MIDDLGKTNPWAAEWFCPRKDCLPCQGRSFLAQEAEEEAAKMVDKGQETARKVKPEDRVALPSCTSEGKNYILECITCRKAGVRRVYLGETSRSTYQRGREHHKEIQEATPTHPLVIHNVEEHGGEPQPCRKTRR